MKLRAARRSRTLVAVLGVIALVLGAFTLPQPASAATTLIYATFKGDGAADQELWIYQSTNGGASYNVVYDTNFRGPTGVLRDPSIIKRGATYYIAYTVQSWTTNSTSFAVARSTDLRNWTNIATVPSGIPDTRYTWAPEFYIEGSTVRIIASVAQTTCSRCFRPYVYTARNDALTSWSGPAQMWGLGFNYIDTYVVKSGSTWHAFTKNETTKYIEHWTTTQSLTGGWVNRGALWSSGYEGPSMVRMDNGSYRIYIDKYVNGGVWTATSPDLWNWTGLSYVGCSGCRHGTAIPR
ncbi:MAG TPA: family 43 glycosylhydrolase [Micromonosporaceae bacterium]|nr:family 43 glycosylhydrolase [Micromonosporaceae bacterium]